MNGRLKAHVSYANVTATLALLLALTGGTAYAVKKIGSNGIKTNAVKERHIATDAVGGAEVKAGAIGSEEVADNALGGADINEGSLSGVVANDPRLFSGNGDATATSAEVLLDIPALNLKIVTDGDADTTKNFVMQNLNAGGSGRSYTVAASAPAGEVGVNPGLQQEVLMGSSGSFGFWEGTVIEDNTQRAVRVSCSIAAFNRIYCFGTLG